MGRELHTLRAAGQCEGWAELFAKPIIFWIMMGIASVSVLQSRWTSRFTAANN